jgi:Caspase domain
MKRHAILIVSTGADTFRHRLPGVTVDAVKYRNHLISVEGGAWSDHEITLLLDPTRIEIAAHMIRLPRVDGLFVQFSGHGLVRSTDGQTYLKLPYGEFVSEKDLIAPNAIRQLILLDACRSLIYPAEETSFDFGQSLSGSEPFGDEHVRQRARSAYDAALRSCPSGLTVGYACAKHEFAYETPRGGVFSGALLSISGEWANKHRRARPARILPIGPAMHGAAVLIQRSAPAGSLQHPQIAGLDQAARFPFAVAA